MDLIYKKSLPTAEEYIQLRENVGWGSMPIKIVEKSFDKTIYGISVYNDNKIIGSGRIVGDGGLCFYIQDIMVLKDFQKQGIGSKIVKLLMDFLEENAPINSYIGLMSAKGLENFYSKYGFIKRPNEYFGAGMTQFWGRNGEMTES
jgi:predicted GNAT family N-acyltransferase